MRVIGLLFAASAALAQEPRCYARSYSEAHLAANPQQGAAWVSVILQAAGGMVLADLYAIDRAGGGHEDLLTCGRTTQGLVCTGTTGMAELVPSEDGLRLITFALAPSATGTIPGALQLAEPAGARTVFRLYAEARAYCG